MDLTRAQAVPPPIDQSYTRRRVGQQRDPAERDHRPEEWRARNNGQGHWTEQCDSRARQASASTRRSRRVASNARGVASACSRSTPRADLTLMTIQAFRGSRIAEQSAPRPHRLRRTAQRPHVQRGASRGSTETGLEDRMDPRFGARHAPGVEALQLTRMSFALPICQLPVSTDPEPRRRWAFARWCWDTGRREPQVEEGL